MFEQNTGLGINYEKTEVMRVGSLNATNARCYTTLPIKWSDGPIKILGVDIYNNPQMTAKKNYEKAMLKAQNIMKIWAKRLLTLLGRTQIINNLVIAQFTYFLQCLTSPEKEILQQYKKSVRDFIWKEGKLKNCI